MMNTAQLAEALKSVPDQYLVSAVQGGNPNAPGYLALAEMQRRQQLRAQGTQQPPPMSTVAQDETRQTMQAAMPQQMPQQMSPQQGGMGIGGVKRFADGGIVYGGEYGGKNLLPDTTGYEGQTGPAVFADLLRKLYGGYKSLQEKTRPQYLKEAEAAKEMEGYKPRYTPPGPPQWTITEGAEPDKETGATPPVSQQKTPGPVGGGITSVRASSSSSSGGRGAGITKANAQNLPEIPEAPEIGRKDASEFLSKIPTNKILDQLAQEVAVNKKKFEDQRDEVKNAAMARLGALIASKPGGFGGNFAQAVSGAMDYRRAGLQDVDKLERQAELDRRDIMLRQAASEDERYKRASDLSKEDYDQRVNDYARKFGVAKEKATLAIEQAKMENQYRTAIDAANIHAASMRDATSMRVGAGDEKAIIAAFTKARGQAADQAKTILNNPMAAMQAMKKYGTRNADEVQAKLTKELYENAVRNHPFLSQYADEMGIGASTPTATGPQVTQNPNQLIRGR
jgi:hypothetical protein